MPYLSELLKRLSFQYRSIDVRIACFRLGDNWGGILTAVRFSYKTSEELAFPGAIQTEDFKIVFWPLEIERWDQLRNAFASHRLEVGDDVINLERELVDIDAISCNLTPRSSYFQEYDWPQYDGAMIRHSDTANQQQINAMTDQLRARDYNDIYQAISDTLRVHYNQSSNNNQYILVTLPVYAKIDRFVYDGEKLQADVKFHERLKVCRIVAQLLPGEGYSVRTAPKKQQFSRSLGDFQAAPSGQKGFFSTTISDRLPGGVFSDSLYLGLRLDGIIVDEHHDQIERCFRKFPKKLFGQAFPLMTILNRFCSIEEFTNQLLAPEGIKDSARIFERAVSWLLTTCGMFCVLKLDEYEMFRVSGSKFEIGDVDLVAYAATYGAIYLVSCKTTIPNEEDVAKIKECADRLSKEKFSSTTVRLQPVVATPKTDVGRLREECDRQSVRLIDGNDLQNLMEKLRIGDVDGLKGFWGFY